MFTISPFSLGKFFLFIFTLNIEISLVNQSSWEEEEAFINSRIALAVALPRGVESVLVVAATWLRRPLLAERAGTKGISLRSLVGGVAWGGISDVGGRIGVGVGKERRKELSSRRVQGLRWLVVGSGF